MRKVCKNCQLDNGRTLCLDCDAVLGWNYNRARKESPDVVGQNL